MPQPADKKAACHVARERGELEQAFSRTKISLFNALPLATIFVAKQKSKVVATVTLIPDSPMGLPMDRVYKKKLDVLRKKRLRIAEVCQLAIDEKLFPKEWFAMFNFSKLMFLFGIFKLVFDYARNVAELDGLCIVVNPKYQYLYKFLFFKPMGKTSAFHLTLSPELKEKAYRDKRALYKIFYGKNTNSALFKNKFVMKPTDLEYFFVKKTNLFKGATKKQMKYIQSCYPDIKKRGGL